MNVFMRRMAEDVPLMTTERLAVMLGEHAITEKDIKAAEHPYFKQIREVLRPQVQTYGDIAVVPIEGTLAYNPDPFEMLYYGVEDSRAVLSAFLGVAANPNVNGILIRMDTPGGMMLGGPEISDAVEATVKAGKPVVTHIGGLGASLGYMIAAPSTEIFANKSALVGSIGVISSIQDWSKYLENLGVKFEYFTNKEAKFKAAGAVGTSLSDDQRAYIQSRVDSAFSVFKGTVNASRPDVKPEAMQGQVFRGDEAVKLGLVDGIGSEGQAMAALRRHVNRRMAA